METLSRPTPLLLFEKKKKMEVKDREVTTGDQAHGLNFSELTPTVMVCPFHMKRF